MNTLKDNRGSALLIALLVMGVLITVSLLLSRLVFKEIREIGLAIEGGRAYYSAESGVELAMLNLENNLPGWSTENREFNIADELRGEFSVKNTCSTYPCFDEGYDVSNAPPEAFYDYLDLNESITIPLFVVDEEGQIINAEGFNVQYYAPFNVQRDLDIESGSFNLAGWDILRWKIFGKYDPAGQVRDLGPTESIGDFTAVSTVSQGVVSTSEEKISYGNIAEFPSWFGTERCNSRSASERVTDKIKCIPYFINNAINVQNSLDTGQEASLYAGICSASEAREYYEYAGKEELRSEDIHSCYPIADFLKSHSLNYLTLTNLMNPAVFKSTNPDVKQMLSRLYFRVELFGSNINPEANKTVREYAVIKSNGYSKSSLQTIEASVRRGEFLPVFNFSLYSTSTRER